MRVQNLSLWAHKQIDIFEDIQKEFIAAVFDYLASPSNLPCHLNGNISLLLSRHRFLMQFTALWLRLVANAYCLWSRICV